MYKRKKKNKWKKYSHIAYWIKRRLILITTAFMIGMSNAMHDEDTMANKNPFRIEQKDKKE